MEYTLDDARNNLSRLVADHETFVIYGLSGKILEATELVEKEIERQKKSCRIYTRNRIAGAVATSWVPVLSWANFIAIAAHNIATYNPDYEIGKDLAGNRVYVTYKKSK